VTDPGAGPLNANGGCDPVPVALSDAAPVSLGLASPGSTARDIAADDDLVWVATLEGVATLRQVEDGPAVLHGLESTDKFSMAVAPTPGQRGAAYGGVWSEPFLLQADAAASAPQAALSTASLKVIPGASEATFSVANRGGADLVLSQVESHDETLSAAFGTDPVAPGSAETVTLDFPDGFEHDDAVCVASSDPGQPVLSLELGTGDQLGNLAVGTYAPDFTLPDVDGVWHTLSDHLGTPVMLVWFATW